MLLRLDIIFSPQPTPGLVPTFLYSFSGAIWCSQGDVSLVYLADVTAMYPCHHQSSEDVQAGADFDLIHQFRKLL